MKAKQESQGKAKEETVQLDPNAVCDICGRAGSYKFEGQTICLDCYESRCSCCPEFGSYDLWDVGERENERDKH